MALVATQKGNCIIMSRAGFTALRRSPCCHYGVEVDMWSLGCILAELVMGYPLLPGHNEDDQMALMIEMLGMPPPSLMMSASRGSRFFSVSTGCPRYLLAGYTASQERRGAPATRDISMVLGGLVRRDADLLMVDFIRQCLDWEPTTRLRTFIRRRSE